jgi:hypothetical protein
MRTIYFAIFLLVFLYSCSSQEKVSQKVFEDISLTSRIDFFDPKLNQPRFCTGFLLQYNKDTFAVTAKHLLKIIKPPQMNTLSFDGFIKNWVLFPLDKKEDTIVTTKLLNQNPAAQLDDKSIYDNDWLVFSIGSNHSTVKPLQARTTPLIPGEKLYVIGWTRKMESGKQRVYEFEYYKTIGHRILLKEVIVPEQFGGLSGAPVVDEQGAVVGIVSNGTKDPDTGKKFFSPCVLDELIAFIQKNQTP